MSQDFIEYVCMVVAVTTVLIVKIKARSQNLKDEFLV